MAKIILSRKGFDSKYGGIPSPILPDGAMLSFPIPANSKETVSLTYEALIYEKDSQKAPNYYIKLAQKRLKP